MFQSCNKADTKRKSNSVKSLGYSFGGQREWGVGRLCLTHAISTINSAIEASDDLSAPKCCQKQPHYCLAFGFGAALCLFACPAGGEGGEGQVCVLYTTCIHIRPYTYSYTWFVCVCLCDCSIGSVRSKGHCELHELARGREGRSLDS